MKESKWHSCYNDSWKGVIIDDAFQHPAKFARGLIRSIYRHALDNDLLHVGDSVIDPFGGVALGGLDAMRYGLHWTGIELEPRFVELGRANIDLWNATYKAAFPQWGTAQLLQGDSRELAARIREARGVVSSPPYADGCTHTGGDTPTSAEYINGGTLYGAGIEGVVSSPPYAQSIERPSGIDMSKVQSRYGPNCQGAIHDSYGVTPGQLGAMKANGFQAAVSSPPFEMQIAQQDRSFTMPHDTTGRINGDYGSSPGQLGQSSGDDFWTAARVIVEQVYLVLTPGGVAIWVTKDFVRNKARVPFSEQWVQLCEAVGFTLTEWNHASLVIDNGTQMGMFGDDVELTKERKSFFRRLAEKKGSPRIDWEDVTVMVKR